MSTDWLLILFTAFKWLGIIGVLALLVLAVWAAILIATYPVPT